MAGWVCADCTTVYSVGAPRCPHCQSTTHYEEGAMPKNTVHSGPSNRYDPETAGAVNEPPASTAPALRLQGEHGPEVIELEGGSRIWPGSSSATSSPSSEPNSEPTATAPPSRARPTASRSKKARTATSTAPSTDGNPADGTSETGEDGK